MKKSNIKLFLNKKNISNLKTATVKGGVTGTTCKFTNKYYNTCFINCDATWHNCPSGNTVFICDH